MPTKVLIVDDSAFMRKMLRDIVDGDAQLTVVGTARDGSEALRLAESLHPDVITLDVDMPVMDGYATLVELMRSRPTPVVMVSSLTQDGADMTLRCLAAGAVDVVGKPSGAISLDIKTVGSDIVAKIKVAASAIVRHSLCAALRHDQPAQRIQPATAAAPAIMKSGPSLTVRHSGANGLVVIGASTGGPRALHVLVSGLNSDLALPGIIVQHMPAGFTASLAKRLDADTSLNVREAVDGEPLQVGTILVAPGGRHLVVDSNRTVRLCDDPPVHGVRPSVDITLDSVARVYGASTVAVLLTGMGRDGARGLKVLHDLGAATIAEDQSTCVIYGMPKAAADLGAVGSMLPLEKIAPVLMSSASACSASPGRGAAA